MAEEERRDAVEAIESDAVTGNAAGDEENGTEPTPTEEPSMNDPAAEGDEPANPSEPLWDAADSDGAPEGATAKDPDSPAASDDTPDAGPTDQAPAADSMRKSACPPFSLQSVWGIAAALLLFWGLHSFWTSWRLNAFCGEVQQAVNAPDGIGKLSKISDWRVREIAEGTLQVSRGDGAYTVYVWRLAGGGYLVDTIARRP